MAGMTKLRDFSAGSSISLIICQGVNLFRWAWRGSPFICIWTYRPIPGLETNLWWYFFCRRNCWPLVRRTLFVCRPFCLKFQEVTGTWTEICPQFTSLNLLKVSFFFCYCCFVLGLSDECIRDGSRFLYKLINGEVWTFKECWLFLSYCIIILASFDNLFFFSLTELIENWHLLESSVEAFHREGLQQRELQQQMVLLKGKLHEMQLALNAIPDEDLEQSLNHVRLLHSQVDDQRKTLLQVNVAVHKCLTWKQEDTPSSTTSTPSVTTLTNNVLKEEVADLYQLMDQLASKFVLLLLIIFWADDLIVHVFLWQDQHERGGIGADERDLVNVPKTVEWPANGNSSWAGKVDKQGPAKIPGNESIVIAGNDWPDRRQSE